MDRGPRAGRQTATASSHRLAQWGFAEDLVDAAELAQAGFGLAADPAADRLDRDAELPGRGLLGEAFALEDAGDPLRERAVLGTVPADRGEAGADGGGAAQDVDLDAVGKIRKHTWMWPPSGLAASSSAFRTAWWSCWWPCGVRGDSAR
jgi:hypothetical protein